jgi:hypothetical protein
MSPATNSLAPALKRARGSDASEAPIQTTAPSEAARDRVASAVASLPKLTKQLAEFWCTKVNTSYAKVTKQTKTLASLTATPESIPRSARVSFAIAGSRLVTGLPEFKTLADATKELVDQFQKDLKTQIVAAAELELAALKKEHSTVVFSAVTTFATIFLLASTEKPATAEDLWLFVDQARTRVVTASVAALSDPERAALFTELSGFAVPMEAAAPPDPTNAFTLTAFLGHCKTLFVDPCVAYDSALRLNAVALAAHNLTTLAIGNTTTAAVATALDDEPTITSTQMESLVNASVKKATDALRSQLRKELESKPPAKNATRGAADRASLKKKPAPSKKQTPPTTATPKTTVAPVRKAAAAASVSFKEPPASTKNTGRGKSKRKNTSRSGVGHGAKK